MITVREVNTVISETEGAGSKYLVRLDGKSTDEKPVGRYKTVGRISNGSTFFEMDTGKKYMYDGDAGEWIEVSGSGGGDEPSSDDIITPTDADNIWDNAENQHG